jgi:hypothetical protein
MYKVRKPLQLKIEGAFRNFVRGATIAEDLIEKKMAKALLVDGFIEEFIVEKAVFHNEGKIKPADKFKRDVPEEYKELKNVPDLEILDKPKIKEKIQIIEEEPREEVLKIPELVEKNVAVKRSQKDKKVKPMIVEETYKEEAKIKDLVDRNREVKSIEKKESVPTEDKVEGPLNNEIAEEIFSGVKKDVGRKNVSRKKPAKKRTRTKKKVG